MKKIILSILTICFVFALSISAFAVTSDVIEMTEGYVGRTEGVLLGTDFPRNANIPDEDLCNQYEPWMQMAAGDYFTEQYYHEYQVYWKAVNAGIIKEGEDLDLSLVFKEDDGSEQQTAPAKEVVGYESSVISLRSDYKGDTEGVLKGSDYPVYEALSDLDMNYTASLKMSVGSFASETWLHNYQVYRKAVDAGIIEAGEDLDLGLVIDTVVYSDGTKEISAASLQLRETQEYNRILERNKASRIPSAIICAVLLVILIIVVVIVLKINSDKRYKAYLKTKESLGGNES